VFLVKDFGDPERFSMGALRSMNSTWLDQAEASKKESLQAIRNARKVYQ
jgi:hypothetical protein